MKRVQLDDRLKKEILKRGAGTHYGYQGCVRCESSLNKPKAVIQYFPTYGCLVEDVARDTAKSLAKEKPRAFYEAIVGVKSGKSYLIRVRQLPIPRR